MMKTEAQRKEGNAGVGFAVCAGMVLMATGAYIAWGAGGAIFALGLWSTLIAITEQILWEIS